MVRYVKTFSTQEVASASADVVAAAVESELPVKDFSSYYHCGPACCCDPQYSVTSHAAVALHAPCYASTSCCVQNDLPRSSSATYTDYVDDNSPVICKSSNEVYKSRFELGSKNSYILVRNTTSSIFCSSSRVKFREPNVSSTNVSKTLKVTFSNELPDKDLTKLYPKNSKMGYKNEQISKKMSQSSHEKETAPEELVDKRISCLKTNYRKPVNVAENRRPRASSVDLEARAKRPPEDKKAEKVEFVDDCRRVLYNEGIDDAAAFRASLQARSSMPLLLDRIGSWNWCSRDGVPFMHGHKSRYHRNCIEDTFKRHRLDRYSGSRSRCSLQACRNFSNELVPLALCRSLGMRQSRRHLAAASDTESNKSLLLNN